MNKKISIISLLLACTFAFGACKGIGGFGNSNTIEISDDVKTYEGGIHEYSAQATSDYLVKNHDSEYTILLPENASEELVTTAEDMQDLILEASGVRLEIVEETSQASILTNVISVGATKKSVNANVKPTTDLQDVGYMIKTVGKNVYVVANSDYAVSFGVYAFLKAQFGFECLSDVYYYIDKTDSVKLLNLDVKDVPDLGKVQIGSGFVNGKAIRRMGLLDRPEYVAGYETVHTSNKYIDPLVYNNQAEAPDTYHPDWFASGANQLCYLARGNETERIALVNEVANIVINYFVEDPSKSYFCFGQMDEYTWCGCSHCEGEYSKYSSHAAVVIKFLNDVTKVIDTWMAGEGSEHARDYLISFIAYQKTLAAPKLIDDSVKCSKNVAVMFCPYQMDLKNSLYAEINKDYLQVFEDWRKVAPNFAYFGYFYFQKTFLHYFDCFESMKEIFLYLAESNTRVFYTESPPQYKASGYHALRTYVLSKLAWNVNLDIDELIKNFCEKYYMDAADVMMDILYEERALYGVNREALTMANFFSQGDLSNKKLWPKNLVLDWYNRTNEALEKISYLKKTDPDLYDIIYHNITLERLSFEYILISSYEKELAVDFVNTLKVQAIQDAEENDVLMFALNVSISTIFDAWGV